MASTNHTKNYSLSQFAQTDKPAWLGDYNQDMTKIDTAMKNNADGISTVSTTVAGHTTAIAGNTSDIATAQADITSLTGRVTAVETKNTEQDTAISNAQTSADTANGKADTNTQNIATNTNDITALQRGQSDIENDVDALETATQQNTSAIQNIANELNLSQTPQKIEGSDCLPGVKHVYSLTNLTLMQSPNSALFKMYGRLDIGGGSGAKTIAKTAITGLSGYYGFKTSLKLSKSPSESYIVTYAGSQVTYTPGADPGARARYSDQCNFAVDTDGYIWLSAGTENTLTIGSYERRVELYFAELYFNTNFGDIPTPPEQNA